MGAPLSRGTSPGLRMPLASPVTDAPCSGARLRVLEVVRGQVCQKSSVLVGPQAPLVPRCPPQMWSQELFGGSIC